MPRRLLLALLLLGALPSLTCCDEAGGGVEDTAGAPDAAERCARCGGAFCIGDELHRLSDVEICSNGLRLKDSCPVAEVISCPYGCTQGPASCAPTPRADDPCVRDADCSVGGAPRLRCDEAQQRCVAGTLRQAGDGRLRDALGREVLLRGVNARVEGVFDVTFDDGRVALEPIPPFGEADCALIGESLGMNHLRLPINWSGLEPAPGVYDEAYLARALAVASACAEHGVMTLIDLHQDAWSKHIGEDGAPLWAIVPAPTELLEGPLEDLEARRASLQVQAAFESFWEDEAALQQDYEQMVRWLAPRVEGQPGVIGLELMNEPVIIVREGRLDDFHDRMARAVTEAAPTLLIFFEPNSLRNFTDRAPVRRPIAVDNAVYAPHIYTDVFEDGWASEDTEAVAVSVARAAEEADAHQAALYIGEFGHGPDARGQRYIAAVYEAMDAQRASGAFWLYEEWSQGTWGLYEATGEPAPGRGALREAMAALVARPYPAAIAGDVVEMVYDEGARTLRVTMEAARGDLDHVLAVPAHLYPEGVEVTCDGAPAPVTLEGGRARTRCDGARLELRPAAP